MKHYLIIWRHYDGNVDVHRITTESPELIRCIDTARGNYIDNEVTDDEQDVATREIEGVLENRVACISTNDGGGRTVILSGDVDVVMMGRCLS